MHLTTIIFDEPPIMMFNVLVENKKVVNEFAIPKVQWLVLSL